MRVMITLKVNRHSLDRLNAIKDSLNKKVAEFHFELVNFGFDKCGMLDFKHSGNGPIGISPLRVPDMGAEKQLQECSPGLV